MFTHFCNQSTLAVEKIYLSIYLWSTGLIDMTHLDIIGNQFLLRQGKNKVSFTELAMNNFN